MRQEYARARVSPPETRDGRCAIPPCVSAANQGSPPRVFWGTFRLTGPKRQEREREGERVEVSGTPAATKGSARAGGCYSLHDVRTTHHVLPSLEQEPSHSVANTLQVVAVGGSGKASRDRVARLSTSDALFTRVGTRLEPLATTAWSRRQSEVTSPSRTVSLRGGIEELRLSFDVVPARPERYKYLEDRRIPSIKRDTRTKKANKHCLCSALLLRLVLGHCFFWLSGYPAPPRPRCQLSGNHVPACLS